MMAKASTVPSPLREHRLASGLTQAELATLAGVSRQLVAAVEAGHHAPSVEAAIGLARVLSTTVESLFAPATGPAVEPVAGAIADGIPLRVGRVGDRMVAAELADHGTAGASWASADGLLENGVLCLHPGASPAGLVVAGCDPALGVAEAMLQGLGPRRLLAVSAATGTALRALERGRVHAAVVHGRPGELPQPPVPVARWQLAHWQVGLGVARSLGRLSLESLLNGDVAVVQREPAAASQQALGRAATQAGLDLPKGPRARGHIEAARLAATVCAAAVTTESAARAFDLRFRPLEHHTVEVWLARDWVQHPAAESFGELLRDPAFIERVARLAGYDLEDCGERLGSE